MLSKMVQQKEAIKGRSKLFDIMIMRAVATIMVVAFHVYGVMYANHFPAMREKYYAVVYFCIWLFIYLFIPEAEISNNWIFDKK